MQAQIGRMQAQIGRMHAQVVQIRGSQAAFYHLPYENRPVRGKRAIGGLPFSRRRRYDTTMVRTLIVLGSMILSAACGERLNTASCTQTKGVESKSPILPEPVARDTEIPDPKNSSERSIDERETDSPKISGKTTADNSSGMDDTENIKGSGSEDSVNLPNTAARVFPLSKGRLLRIDDKEASIVDKNDQVLCKNETLIRLQDEYFNCMSDGFRSVKNKKNGFVFEQQSCSNTYIISETIEFRLSSKGDEVYLYRFDLEYMDKFTDAHESKYFRLTNEDFGRIRFENVDLEKLYDLAWTKAEKAGAVK